MRPRCRYSHVTTLVMALCALAHGQTQPAPGAPTDPTEQLRQLSLQVQAAEQHVLDSEQELAALKLRLAALEVSLKPAATATPAANTARTAAPATPQEDSAETAAMQANQIATLDQTKVESSSKFPLRVTGMVLMTASVNSSRVDSSVDPTSALGGPGSTSLSLRQTVLGIDATGPHLAGASSSADLSVDFFGTSAASSYASAGDLLRMRSAHAALDWNHARLFFAYDRTLLNPNTPASLVQVADPALSWSGNLWNWAPQLGASVQIGQQQRFLFQGAWISPSNAPYPSAYAGTQSYPASTSESSRIPAGEVRIAYESSDPLHGLRIGAGGYVAPHTVTGLGSFDSWAGTLDLRAPLGRHAEFAGSFYRGAGLGGLGGGGYKDWVAVSDHTKTYLLPLSDIGGWAQLSLHLSSFLDWNNSFGLDNAFADQLRSYATTSGYGDIARNRTLSSNLIWSPRPYLPFSFEYRRLNTAPVTGYLWVANIFAFGGGYRF